MSAARPAAGAAPFRPSVALILMLGSMSVFGPLSINMYLPAVPAIGHDLAASTPSIQATVASCMFGIAGGQIFWGAAAERLGRRLPVLIGFSIYLLASIACAVAGSSEALLVARLFQGLGACAGMVLARAIVSDQFEGSRAATIFSWQQLIMGMAPIFSPLLGGALLITLGWRSMFWVMAAAAAALLLALHFRLPESQSVAAAQHARTESRFTAYRRVVANGRVLAHILAGGLSAATLLTWYTSASPLFQEDFGWSAAVSSVAFGALGVCIVAATQLNRPLLRRFAPRQIVDGSAIGGIVVVLIALVPTLAQPPGAHFLTAAGLILGVASYGFISANNQACALDLDRLRGGSISALIGTANYGVGAVIGSFLTLLPALHGATMLGVMAMELGAAWLLLHFFSPPLGRASVLEVGEHA